LSFFFYFVVVVFVVEHGFSPTGLKVAGCKFKFASMGINPHASIRSPFKRTGAWFCDKSRFLFSVRFIALGISADDFNHQEQQIADA